MDKEREMLKHLGRITGAHLVVLPSSLLGSPGIGRRNCTRSTPVWVCVQREIRGRRLKKSRLKLCGGKFSAGGNPWPKRMRIIVMVRQKSTQGFVGVGYLAPSNLRAFPNREN